MPSKTPKQAKFMRAIAHGWTPSRAKNPPSRAVAQEFVDADRKYSGGFAENRYWVGGLAAMDKVNAGFQGSLDNPFREFEEGGDVYRRGGRTRRNGGGGSGGVDLGGLTESPYTYEEQVKRDAFLNKDIQPNGVISTALYNIQQRNLPPPESTITAPTAETYTPTPQYVGPRMTSGRRGTGRRGRGGRRNGGGGDRPPGGAGGPGTTPRTIIPTNPASYVGGAAGASSGESPYREELRQHQAKIAATLGSARGGHVTGYAEGGTTRADNPFDPVKQKYQWRRWERKYGRDPDIAEPEAAPPPEPEAVAEEENGGIAAYLRSLFTPDPATAIGSGEARGTTEEQLEEMEQAYGGRVRYQAGGLATAAPGRILPPAGGVPPWIEPVGSGPGFSEPEPEGYQFGGMAARMGPAMRMARGMRGRQQGGGGQYRGVPPQRGGIRGGGQPGGGGFMGMGNRARQAYAGGQNVPGMSRYLQMNRGPGQSTRMNIPPGGTPQGALAQMYGRAQQQQGAQPGGGGPFARMRQMAEQQRAQQAGGGPDRNPPGYNNEVGRAMGPIEGLPPPDPNATVYDRDWPPRGPMAPGGGPIQLPPNYDPRIRTGPNPNIGRPGYDPIGDMGPITGGGRRPWKQPGRRIAPPPGKEPGGGGIIGGPRIPPNMQGYLQRQRMMNRPPANVGGGANRVGMQDQQGAQARALQRGTGRPPMSRRFGRGRAGQTR